MGTESELVLSKDIYELGLKNVAGNHKSLGGVARRATIIVRPAHSKQQANR
jgi:hypothetical protein